MPASLIQYRLRVRTVSTLANPDGVSDAFTVSSVPADALPFIAAAPTGDGQEVDPITGAVRTGAYTLEIVDATTGTDGTGTIRALTSRLEDADFRQQLLSRRAFLEIRTDGGAWSTLVAGYVLGVRLVGPVRYAVTIGDTRRVEQTQAIFQGAALGAFQTRGCLTGGPLTADWGPVKARGGWRYRVQRLSGDDVELVFVEGYPVGADAPLLRDWRKVARPAIADAVGTYRQPNPYAIGGTSQFVTAYTTPVYDTATNDWVIGGGVVPIIGTTATNGAPVRALVVGLSTPQATEMLGVAPLYLYWPSCPYSTGDIVFVSLTTADVTENTPLYLDAHPVDIVTAIWTNARIRYDSGGAWIAAMRSLIGDNVRVALRLTSAPVIATFLEQAIYGPFGIAARTTAAGLQELFPTRIRTDVVPSITLGAASLRDTDALVFDLDENTAVSAIELTQQVFAPAVYVEGAAATNGTTVGSGNESPLDGVMASQITQTAQYLDPALAVFAGRTVSYKVPGMIHTATDFAPNVGAQMGAIAVSMFDRYGRGASAADAPVLAGTAAAALQVGDEVYYEGPSYPNKGYRIGESTVGARIMQVVRRTETPAGPLLKLSDSGLAAQPATQAVITIAKFIGSPTTTASYTITNAATLNAGGVISVVVEYASGASTPTGAADHARYAPGQIPTGAILLPPRTTAGQTMHVRARSEQAGRRPSAWTAWASVALDAIPTISGFSIGTTTRTSAAISWTNTSSTLAVVVFAVPSGTAPSNWAPFRVASMPAGSTSTIVRTLTGPSVTWTLGVAYESAGILGPVTSASVTTNNTVGTSGRPAGLQVIAGLDDVTQTQGIALALWPSDQTLDVVIERSLTTLSGFVEIARVAGSTPTYVDERPRDGTTYYYRTAHVLGGFGLSPYTQEVSAIARGVGRDLVRPDAVTPVVVVSTTEVGTTATVLLDITDPQGRVEQVRFRDRTNGGAWSGWTIDSTVPYSYSATIPTVGFVDIEYEVTGYTAAGISGLLAGGVESFDINATVDMVSVVGTYTDVGAFVLAVSADTDTASLRIAFSSTSQPTLATTQAQAFINGRTYSTTLTGPYAPGSTLFISVLGYTGANATGEESVLFEYRFARGASSTQCLAVQTTSTATQIVVTVTGTAPTGTPTVQLVAVTGSATLAAGAAIGTPVASGSQWTFNRGAALGQPGGAQFRAVLAGTVSDDDFIEIPEQGRDTTYLTTRARIISTSNTQVTVRYAVLDKYSALSTTVTYISTGVGTVTPASPQTVTAAVGDTFTSPETAGSFVDVVIDRPAFQAGAGRVTFTAAATGRVSDSDAVDVPAVEQDTVYAQCLATVTASTDTQVTVTVTATGTNGTPTVQLVAVTGSATLASGAAIGTPVVSGSTWTFNRGAALGGTGGAQFRAVLAGNISDDDFVEVPEQGRDTVTLASRARVLSTNNTQVVVRYAVADSFPQGANSVTVAYQALGVGTVTPASGGTLTPAATLTEAAGTFIDYTIARPAFGAGAGRVTFTATAANRVSDSDAVDVPAVEQDTQYAQCLAVQAASTATQIVVTVTGTGSGGTPTVQLVAVTGSATLATGAAIGTPVASGSQWTFNRGAALGQPGGAQFRAVLTGNVDDDDFIEIPEQGRDTTYILTRARAIAETATTVTVRVAVLDKYSALSTSIAYLTSGIAGVSLSSPQTVTAAVGDTFTIPEVVGSFADFVVDRPAANLPTGRITFTATATGRVADTDSADIQSQTLIPPSLNIVTTPGATSFSLVVTWDGTIVYNLDGVSQSVSGWTSPRTVTINRNAAGGATKAAAFAVTQNSATTSQTVGIPPQDPVIVTITSFSITYDYANDEIDYNYTLTGLPSGYDIRCFAFLNGMATGELIESSSTSTQTVVGSPVPLDSSGSITNEWEHWFEVTDGGAQVLATSISVYGTTYEP
jgi:hypothetical protein